MSRPESVHPPVNDRLHFDHTSVLVQDFASLTPSLNKIAAEIDTDFAIAMDYRGCEETVETVGQGLPLDDRYYMPSFTYDALLRTTMSRANVNLTYDTEFHDKHLHEAVIDLSSKSQSHNSLISVSRDESGLLDYRLEQPGASDDPADIDELSIDETSMQTILSELLCQSGYDISKLGDATESIKKIELLAKQSKLHQVTHAANYLWTSPESGDVSTRITRIARYAGERARKRMEIDILSEKSLDDNTGIIRTNLQFAAGNLVINPRQQQATPYLRLQVGLTDTSYDCLSMQSRNSLFTDMLRGYSAPHNLRNELQSLAAYLTSPDNTAIDFREYTSERLPK